MFSANEILMITRWKLKCGQKHARKDVTGLSCSLAQREKRGVGGEPLESFNRNFKSLTLSQMQLAKEAFNL